LINLSLSEGKKKRMGAHRRNDPDATAKKAAKKAAM
jgi:hypothetical protein